MKLLITWIILVILFSPIIIENVFADHITGYDDNWYIKEIDNTTGNCETTQYTLGSGITTAISSAGRFCVFFKVFATGDLNGHEIDRLGANTRTGGSPVYHYTYIYDGSYDPSNTTDFPQNGMLSKGAGVLYSSGGTVAPTDPFTPDLSSSELNDVTLFLHWNQDDGTGSTTMSTSVLTVADLGTWIFPRSFPTGAGPDIWTVTQTVLNGNDDYWTVLSYNPSLPDPVTNLSANAVNNTAITITWTDAVDQASSTQSPDIDGYHIFYQNGTNAISDSFYWTKLADVSQGVGTYTSNIFQAGHTYSFKILTYGYDILSVDSSTVTETTTGTSTATQTMDTIKSTYDDDGIEDNAFYSRENVDGDGFSTISHTGSCAYNDLVAGVSGGWRLGVTTGGTGLCYGHIKSFPTSLVDGVVWNYDATFHRDIGGVYHTMEIWDGEFDVFDSTIFYPDQNYQFSDQSTSDYYLGAGVLYSSGGTSTPTDPFTPNLSSAQLDTVTFMDRFEDDDANDTYGVFRSLIIDDTYKFYFSKTNRVHGIENLITGTEHDISRLHTTTPPKSPTGASGVKSGETGVISYTIPEYDGGRPLGALQVWRQCEADSDYVDYQTISDIDGSYTDEEFGRTLSSVTLSVEPDHYYDFSTQTGWTETSPLLVDENNGRMDLTPVADFSNDSMKTSPDFTTFGNTWAMEFEIIVDQVSEDATNGLYIGMDNTDGFGTNIPTDNKDFIGIAFVQESGDHTIYAYMSDATTKTATPFDYEAVPGQKLFVHIERNDVNNASVSLYSDPAFSVLIEEVALTPSSGISGIVNAQISNYEGTFTEGTDHYYLDDMRIWDGVDEITHTPVYTTTDNGSCNYKIGGVNYHGAGFNSTAFTISATTNAPTFSNTGDHVTTASWSASGLADVTGYAIRYSTDQTNWVYANSNTSPDTTTSYVLSGLNPSTTYYVQWADIVGGQEVTWSGTGDVTTLSPQGSGGGNKNEIPPEDLTDEFIPPEPKKGLQALDLFQANLERISLGQTKSALLQLVWEGDDNLRIEEIIADESTGLKFAFQQPIEFPPHSTGKTTSEIPYVIEAPNEPCTDTQTPKCVYDDATYEIPIQIFATSNGESIQYNSLLKVQVGGPFEFGMREMVFAIIGMVALAVILGRTRTPKRSKVMSHKSRPKTR